MIRSFLVFVAMCLCARVDAASITGQGPYKQTATTGYIDPTVATFNINRPLVSCASACSTALVNQNTDALIAAVALAAGTAHPWIHLPPGEYPMARGGTLHNQRYGILMSGITDIVFQGYGATIRGQAALGGSDFYMFQMMGNTKRVRFIGITFSQRDLTAASEQTHMVQLGDGNTAVEDVQIVNCTFIEGIGGDAIRLLGGSDNTHLIKRVTITGNAIDGKRSGIGFQHGTNMINIVGNWFGTNTTDNMIDHEPSSIGGTKNLNAIGNVLARTTGSGAQIATLSGYDQFDSMTEDTVFADNLVANGSMNAININRTWVIGNRIHADNGSGSFAIDFFRKVETTWIEDNWIKQTSPFGLAARCIRFASNAGFNPHGAWITGNRLENWHPLNSADIGAATGAWVVGNNLSYHNATGDSGSGTGYNGISMGAGWAAENTISRGYLADGVTLAGRMLAGIIVNSGTYTFVRDNVVNGARNTIDRPSSTPFPAQTLIAGNRGLNVSTEKLPPSYTTHWSQAETVASGALSPSRRISNITTVGVQGYSIGACPQDGAVHSFKVHTATSSPVGTLTPSSFGDGTSISWIGPARFNLVCDAGTHRLLDSSGITVNP